MNIEEAEEEKEMKKSVRAECPLCGKDVDRRGLLGHIRYSHGKSTEEAHKEQARAKPSRAEKLIHLKELIDELEQIRVEIARVEKVRNEKGLFSSDEAVDGVIKALKQNEAELTKEIKSLTAEEEEHKNRYGFF